MVSKYLFSVVKQITSVNKENLINVLARLAET